MPTQSLKGQFLIAMPNLADPRFQGSVIYLVGHNDDGAMGLIINQTFADVSIADLISDLNLEKSSNSIVMPPEIASRAVMRGGPVETERGFVLHSRDYFCDEDTYAIDAELGLTATLDVLRAIAGGKGPQDSLLALGYCGWGPGQLEDEMQSNSWLNVPCSKDLLFSVPIDERYEKALALIGITHASLSALHGSA
jgi:putative transcriptional regulator